MDETHADPVGAEESSGKASSKTTTFDVGVTAGTVQDNARVTGIAVGAIQGPVTIHVTSPAVDLEAIRRAAAEALRQPILPLRPFEPETVLIPAGPFPMGSDDPAAPASEGPQHIVDLPDFRIGRYPVKNEEYAAFLKDRPDVQPPAKSWWLRQPPAAKRDHPVVNVSWREARAYCDWLSQEQKTGRCYRLPTEAEWEKAARGRENTRYPWGNDWRDGMCNVGGAGTTPVCAFPDGASSYGCQNMLGNVEEWTHTIWGSQDTVSDFPYPYRSDDGREDPDAARYAVIVRRVVRGGSYASASTDVVSFARTAAPEEDRLKQRGFRVMMEIPQTKDG
ncbi:MAG: SUMF1/EgtB/PvdO family nonheme iron enzyme [Chloroflexi bacterium]|nr:SUMF1/EgtB/PvdO family nonheme iron enzyme [Chloroflexota bacterium]